MRALSLLLLAAVCLCGCRAPVPPAPASPVPLRAGLVVAPGLGGPGTFNAQALAGAQEALAAGGTLEVRAASGSLEMETQLQALAAAGVEHFVTIGPQAADATALLADRRRHLTFSMVDFSFDPALPNAQGLIFREDQAAYLAGALAGMVSESGTLGVVAARDAPRTRKYANGFAQGARAACPECRVLVGYAPADTPAAGMAEAEALLAAGADVLFGVGGQAAEAALRRAARAEAWVIGAETDAYLTLFGGGAAPGAARVLTSAVKRVDAAVAASVAARRAGAFTAGTLVFGAAEGGVGLAPFHEAEAAVTAAMRERLEQIEAGLRAGAIETGVRFDTGGLEGG